jgi:hypothetical protein
MAETVIGALEDAEDYKAFEAAIIADYNVQSAVERELVLRLASLLWRLRRATSIETGLFEVSKGEASDQNVGPSTENCVAVVQIGALKLAVPPKQGLSEDESQSLHVNDSAAKFATTDQSDASRASDLARRFLRLAALDNRALERLSHYEAALWRQAWQIIVMLDLLRRKNLDTKWLPTRSYSSAGLRLPRSLLSRI